MNIASPRYNEAEPNGPIYYAEGQAIHSGANDLVVGSYWADGAQGRVVTILEYDAGSQDHVLESEFADATDYAEWEVTEDPDNPILLRKRKWVLDLAALQTWFEGELGRPLDDNEGITIGFGDAAAQWDARLTELPKTRWTKEEWEAAQ